jgi:hypothetical protein
LIKKWATPNAHFLFVRLPGQSISRILSGGRTRLGEHLSGTHLSVSLVQPTRGYRLPEKIGRRAASRPSKMDFAPAWPCSRRGLPGRPHCCGRRWSLTPPFHPYRRWRSQPASSKVTRHLISPLPAVVFCGPIRQVTPPRVLPGAVLYGVRTFLDPVTTGPRSPDQPGKLILLYIIPLVNLRFFK